MKKFISMCLILLSLFSKAQTHEEKIIQTIEAVIQASHGESMINSLSTEYIYNNGDVVGKKYIIVGYPNRYNKILLRKENGNIVDASFISGENERQIKLSFNGDKLEEISMPYYFEFRIKYGDDGLILFSKSGSSDIVHTISFDDKKRVKIIVEAIRPQNSKPYIHKMTNFEYSENALIKTQQYYKANNKDTSDKNIIDKEVIKYSIVDNDGYSKEYLDNGLPNDKKNEKMAGTKIIYTYDKYNRKIKTYEINKLGETREEAYFYIDDNSKKFVKKITKGNYINEKYIFIDISEDLPKTENMKNEYEWKKGHYRLDGNNDVYMIVRDGIIREKINGVWKER